MPTRKKTPTDPERKPAKDPEPSAGEQILAAIHYLKSARFYGLQWVALPLATAAALTTPTDDWIIRAEAAAAAGSLPFVMLAVPEKTRRHAYKQNPVVRGSTIKSWDRNIIRSKVLQCNAPHAVQTFMGVEHAHPRVLEVYGKGKTLTIIATHPARLDKNRWKNEDVVAKLKTIGDRDPFVEVEGRRAIITYVPPSREIKPWKLDVPTGPADLSALPVLRTLKGEVKTIKLTGGTHYLAVGATGSGKSSFLWALIMSLLPDIKSGRVRVWGCDLKYCAEFKYAPQLFHRLAWNPRDSSGILKFFQELDAEMERKFNESALFKSKEWTPDNPFDLLLIDESRMIHALIKDPEVRVFAADLLVKIITQGRDAGITSGQCNQAGKKDANGEVRELIAGRVLYRTNEASEVNMVLGQGSRANGAEADNIPDDNKHQGCAYMVIGGGKDATYVRWPEPDLHEIHRVADEYACPAWRDGTAPHRHEKLPGWDVPAPDVDLRPGWADLDAEELVAEVAAADADLDAATEASIEADDSPARPRRGDKKARVFDALLALDDWPSSSDGDVMDEVAAIAGCTSKYVQQIVDDKDGRHHGQLRARAAERGLPDPTNPTAEEGAA